MELFPSKYIHIGGDEAPKVRWENCSKCQARIKNEGLKDEHELQSYFIKRIEKFLNAHGRQIIGWDEILEGGLAPNAAVMSWRGISGGIAAAKQKHYVVMSPTSHCYFDYYQGPPELEPLAIGGYLPLGKVYEYEPVPSELGEGETKYILGVQGNVWTEYIATPQHVEYMAFPRACALAEVAWSFPERRDSISFFNRLQKHLNRLDAENINYRWLLPKGFRSMTVFIDRTEFYVEPAMRGVIKYTLDGTEPNRHSAVLSKPIEITENRTVKFKEFKTNGKSGKSYVAEFVKQKPLPALNKKPSEHGLRYELFALDEIIDSMKQIQNLPLLAKGVMEKFDLPDGESVPYRFAAKYYGLLKIPETAVYEFGTISDDGTKLYIDGVEIVNNDGQHGRIDKSSQIALEKGTHEIYLEYFQVGGGKFLQVYSVKKGVKKELSEDELFLE
jgi:hexosaminidase